MRRKAAYVQAVLCFVVGAAHSSAQEPFVRKGEPIPVPNSPGYVYAIMPNGSTGMMRLRVYPYDERYLYAKGFLPLAVPGVPGYAYALLPNGTLGMMALPGGPADQR